MFLQSLFKLGTPDPLRRALEHLDSGEPRAALALLEIAAASAEVAVADTGRLYAAEVLLQLGDEALKSDPEEARQFFARAAEHQPGWADIHHRLGRIAMQAGESEVAARHLDDAMAINPDYLAARLDRVETILRGAGGVLEDHFTRLSQLAPVELAEDLEDLDSLIQASNVDAAFDLIDQLRSQLRSVHRERRACASNTSGTSSPMRPSRCSMMSWRNAGASRISCTLPVSPGPRRTTRRGRRTASARRSVTIRVSCERG